MMAKKKMKIDIKKAFVVGNRLSVETMINDKDPFNCNLPAEYADDKDKLLEKIKLDYTVIMANIKAKKKTEIKDLIGVTKI